MLRPVATANPRAQLPLHALPRLLRSRRLLPLRLLRRLARGRHRSAASPATSRESRGRRVFNISRDVRGIQGAGIFNISRNVRGVQDAGVFNLDDESVSGIQAQASSISREGRSSGPQAAGVFNIAGKVRAPSRAPGSSTSPTRSMASRPRASSISLATVKGGQAAGVFNKADRVSRRPDRPRQRRATTSTACRSAWSTSPATASDSLGVAYEPDRLRSTRLAGGHAGALHGRGARRSFRRLDARLQRVRRQLRPRLADALSASTSTWTSPPRQPIGALPFDSLRRQGESLRRNGARSVASIRPYPSVRLTRGPAHRQALSRSSAASRPTSTWTALGNRVPEGLKAGNRVGRRALRRGLHRLAQMVLRLKDMRN